MRKKQKTNIRAAAPQDSGECFQNRLPRREDVRRRWFRERSADSQRPPQPVCQVARWHTAAEKQTRRLRSQRVPPGDFTRGGTKQPARTRWQRATGGFTGMFSALEREASREPQGRGGKQKTSRNVFFLYCTMRRQRQQEEKTHLWEAQIHLIRLWTVRLLSREDQTVALLYHVNCGSHWMARGLCILGHTATTRRTCRRNYRSFSVCLRQL